MLIKITEKCRMGCTHCLDDARTDLEHHMSFETFKKAVEFSMKYDPCIFISGGEPTEHPMFWQFMDYLAEITPYKFYTVVMTNGMNLNDNDIEKVENLKNKFKGKLEWQVSSIRPYYPLRIDTDQKIFQRKDFSIVRKLEKLEKRGRASQHPKFLFNAKAPQCFNLRSIARKTRSLSETIKLLRAVQKYCTPSIIWDGSIVLGESRLCPKVATIYDTPAEIIDKIINFTCKDPDCWEMLNKLPITHLIAIGEYDIKF